MSSAASIWYLGRVAQRRGKLASVGVIAREDSGAWEPLENPRKIFPKLGQAELTGIAGMTLNPGEYLAFQATDNTKPGSAHYKVASHRVLPHFADLVPLQSLEAARVLFTRRGWNGADQPGRWAVRFSDDRVVLLTLQLNRGSRTLHAAPNRLASVQCFAFDEKRIIRASFLGSPLYELDGAEVLATHDWSPGADYIAHVIRALAGADDPRLPELIAWLELHRDDETGRVSATGADHEKAFEALRSGELAQRLAADRELMAAYLAAVRNDPTVAKAVADAAAHSASLDQEKLREELKCEAMAEIASERQRLQDEIASERQRLQEELDAGRAQLEQTIRDEQASAERTMHERLAQMEARLTKDAEQRVRARIEAAEQELQKKTQERANIEKTIDKLREESETTRAALQSDVARLATELGDLEASRAALQADLAERSNVLATPPSRSDVSAANVFVSLPPLVRSQTVDSNALGDAIATSPILLDAGKSLMRRFVAFMLAGEVPILGGAERDDFILIAEALVASNRLLHFDADATILTVEDIWRRPGSAPLSVVGQAAARAGEGEATFLVELRGIDRSAARSWYPALASYCRKGLFPRRLLLFATLIDEESEEAKALPKDACRLMADGVVAPGAALVAPSILGGGSGAIAFDLAPQPFPEDLSAALSVLTELGVELDLPTSLRIARACVEASALEADGREPLAAAQDFCRAIRRLTAPR